MSPKRINQPKPPQDPREVADTLLKIRESQRKEPGETKRSLLRQILDLLTKTSGEQNRIDGGTGKEKPKGFKGFTPEDAEEVAAKDWGVGGSEKKG